MVYYRRLSIFKSEFNSPYHRKTPSYSSKDEGQTVNLLLIAGWARYPQRANILDSKRYKTTPLLTHRNPEDGA